MAQSDTNKLSNNTQSRRRRLPAGALQHYVLVPHAAVVAPGAVVMESHIACLESGLSSCAVRCTRATCWEARLMDGTSIWSQGGRSVAHACCRQASRQAAGAAKRESMERRRHHAKRQRQTCTRAHNIMEQPTTSKESSTSHRRVRSSTASALQALQLVPRHLGRAGRQLRLAQRLKVKLALVLQHRVGAVRGVLGCASNKRQ